MIIELAKKNIVILLEKINEDYKIAVIDSKSGRTLNVIKSHMLQGTIGFNDLEEEAFNLDGKYKVETKLVLELIEIEKSLSFFKEESTQYKSMIKKRNRKLLELTFGNFYFTVKLFDNYKCLNLYYIIIIIKLIPEFIIDLIKYLFKKHNLENNVMEKSLDLKEHIGFIADLRKFIDKIYYGIYDLNNFYEIILANFPSLLSYDFIYEKMNFSDISIKLLIKYLDLNKLFFNSNIEIRENIALNSQAPFFPQYKYLFNDPIEEVRISVAKNPNAVMYEKEFRKLLLDESLNVRTSSLENPNVYKFEEGKAILYEGSIAASLNLEEITIGDFAEFEKLIENLNLDDLTIFLENKRIYLWKELKRLCRVKNSEVLAYIARVPQLALNEEYKVLFNSKSLWVLENVAANPNAPFFDEYRKLFKFKSIDIKEAIARNPNAARFEEFKQLFNDASFKVRRAAFFNENSKKFIDFIPDWFFPRKLGSDCKLIAVNEDAVKFKEYKKLFHDPSYDIITKVAANEAAANLDDYRIFFKWLKIKKWKNLSDLIRSMIKNPNATRFKEFSIFFTDDFWLRHEDLAEMPRLTNFKEYSLLFNGSSNVRENIALNPEAVKHPLYKNLFFDKSDGSEIVRYAVRKNKNAKTMYPELYRELIPENIGLKDPRAAKYKEFVLAFEGDSSTIAESPIAIIFPEFKKLFKSNDRFILESLAGNEKATEFAEFKQLFDCEEDRVLKRVASNEKATKFEEFRKLFNKDLDTELSLNPSATKFEEFKKLFNNPSNFFNLIRNSEAAKFEEFRKLFYPELFKADYFDRFFENKIEYYRNLSSNVKAAKFYEYSHLFYFDDPIVLENIASNPKAVEFPLFVRVYYEKYWSVRTATYNNKRARERFSELHNKLIPREFGSSIKEILLDPRAKDYEEYKWLFYDRDPKLRAVLASMEKMADRKDFKLLFILNPTEEVQLNLVSNKRAVELSYFETLFYSKYENVLLKLLDLPNVFDFSSSKILFSSLYESVREKVAGHPAAPKFEEYRLLIHDKSVKVRLAVAMNRNAVKCKEYIDLLQDSSLDVVKVAMSNPEIRRMNEFSLVFFNKSSKIIEYLIDLPESINFKEFENLLLCSNWDLRRRAMKVPGAREKFKLAFNKLFPIEWGDNYRLIIFKEGAEGYEEFKMLFTDEIEEVRIFIASHPSIGRYKEASALFTDKSIKVRQRVAANEEAVKLKGYERLFDDIPEVRKFVASNIAAVKFPQFKKLFSDKDPNVRRRVAVNWNAVEFNEYEKLFEDEDDNVKRWILKNIEAERKYPEKCEKLKTLYFNSIGVYYLE
ncbi:MAG: hypothetical protein ACTSRZ_17245 [Promethearchaeota archaeon]